MTARRIAAALVFVAAGVFAVIGSGGKTAVPASVLVTAVGVAVAAAALLASHHEKAWRWLMPVAILALALVATQIHLRHGFPRTHDARLHLWSLWSVHRCMLDGDLYPRWNPYMGLGYPLLQFYPPLTYLVGQPLMFLGLSPVQAGAGLVVLFAWASGLSAAWSAGRLGAGPAARLVAAAALLFAPYHLHDANYRFALAEVAAFALLPPFLVLGREFVRGVVEGRTARAVPWAFVAVATLLLLTHLLTAMMAGIFVVLWVIAEGLFRHPRELPRIGLGLTLLGGLCLGAGGLASFFIVPAIGEMNHTSIQLFMPGPDHPLSGNAIALADLVERYALEGYFASRDKGPENAQPNHLIPFYFGLTLLAGAAAAVILTAGRRRPDLAAPAGAVGGLVLVTGICLLFSAGIPAWLLDGITPLRALQFPWRFLGPAAVGASLALALVVDRSAHDGRWRAGLAALLLVALAVDAFPYLGACDWHAPYRGAVHLHWTGEGETYGERYEMLDAELPTDRFVRVERLRHPPSSFEYRVAQAHRCHREYLTEAVFENYLKKGPRKNDVIVSAVYGVQRRYRAGDPHAEVLGSGSLAAFRPVGEEDFVELVEPPEIEPERMTVQLPPNHDGGLALVRFQAFPGWIYRADGGPWSRAGAHRGMIAAEIAAGVEQVEFRYSWRTPARRMGLILSLLSLVSLVVVAAVSRRRYSRPSTATGR